MVEDAGCDHQIELGIGAELVHRKKTAGRIFLAGDRKAFGGRIAPDNVGFRKNLAQMRHAAANAATEIQHRSGIAGQLACQVDFVTREVVAVAVEKIRLRRENGVVLAGILVEIDAGHGSAPAGADYPAPTDTRTKITKGCGAKKRTKPRAFRRPI